MRQDSNALQKAVRQAVVEVDEYLENGGLPRRAGEMVEALADRYGDRAALLFVDGMDERQQISKVIEICCEYDQFYCTPLFLGITPKRAAETVIEWNRYREDVHEDWWDRLMTFLAGVLFMNGDVREDIDDYFDLFRQDNIIAMLGNMIIAAGFRGLAYSLAWKGDYDSPCPDGCVPDYARRSEDIETLASSLADLNILEEECDDHGYLQFLYRMRTQSDNTLFLLILRYLLDADIND